MKDKKSGNRKVKFSVKQGDVLKTLRKLEANIFDGVLPDPPYGIGFMGKKWDGALPSSEVWQELLRVCKPGAMMLCFGHPRTYHRLACNIEDAGWRLMDCLMWFHGQGMPKSLDISKAIDKKLGAKRTVIGSKPNLHRGVTADHHWGFSNRPVDITAPATPEAMLWDGYCTALKPAYEPIILAMKPYEGTYANNALKWGVAGLNIAACHNGWFPANVILDEEAGRLLDKQSPINKGGKYQKSGQRNLRHRGAHIYGDGIGSGKVNAPDTYGDAGGASRFFYCPKASKQERNAGLNGFPIDRPDKRNPKSMGMWDKKGIAPQQNHHPCLKPLALCRYLATLILPPERDTPRKLIVPYAGSGSEMIGAGQAGWDEIVGIELDPQYVAIAKARIDHWKVQQ